MEAKRRYRVQTPQQVKGVKAILDRLDLSKPWLVDIRPYRENRSLEQQGLYRVWIRIISDHFGYTEDEMHHLLKRDILVHQMIASDPEEHPDFKRKVALVKDERRSGSKEIADAWKEEVIRDVSTTDLNTKQFSRYLDAVDGFARDNGIALPHPDDGLF